MKWVFSEKRGVKTSGAIQTARLAMLVAVFSTAFLAAALIESENAIALTTSFDTWVSSGQTVAVESQTFTIYLSSRTNEIAADYGKGSLFVKNNSCDATGIARICLDNVQYDITGRIYKMKVRGISLAPSIAITRKAPKTEFLVGDGTTFTVKLKNTGGFARNVTFEERIPLEFEVTDVDGILFQPDRAAWKGTLDEGQEVTFTYSVKAKELFDGSLASSLTYFDGFRLKTIYSSKIALKTSSPLVFLTSIGKGSILVGEKDNLTVNLTNRLPETAVITLEVTFDQGLKVVSRPYGAKNTSLHNYIWNGEMFKGSNRSINNSQAWFFEFRGAKVGNSNMRVKASYRPKSEVNASAARTLSDGKQSVVVSNKGVIVRTSLKDATLEANQGKKIRMHLQNLNPYAALRDVQANISTGLLYLPDLFIERMEPQEQLLLADRFFYAPAVDKSTGYVIATNVSYVTEFGDSFDKAFRETVTVQPTQEVSLIKAVSKTTAKSGEEIEVSVSVKNSRLTRISSVDVSDSVSGEFTVIGKNSASIDVKSKSDEKAYTYMLKVPHVGKATVLHINTTIRYSDRHNSDSYAEPADYEISKVTEITVEPEILPLTLTRTIGDSSIYVGEEFDVEYKVVNTADDKVAKNIVLKVPLDYGLDLIGKEESVTIPVLGPGETVVIANFDKRRAKLPGSVQFSQPVLEYENVYGDRYTANGTSTSLSVKESYLQGPVILVEKSAPKTANNTDFFEIKLIVMNNGTEPAEVIVEDEGKRFSMTLPNSTEHVINFSKRYTVAGVMALPRARATYSYGGTTYKTASNAASVEVLDNPVLSIEKTVPSKATNVEPYSVMLRLQSKAQTPVENITVADGERSWAIASIPGEGHVNLTYEEITRTVGSQRLAAASVIYRYAGGLYKVESDSPVLDVEEKKLFSVVKEVSPASAKRAEKVKVGITVKNLHSEELSIIVIDGKKSFTDELKPGEEKNISYEMPADETTGDLASATYTFKGMQLTTTSRQPEFTLLELEPAVNETGQLAEKDKERKKKSFMSALLNALLKVLTWKRGG